MSQFNNNDLFFEPKTTQYGNHMVMSNVHKQQKTKYVNIDTRFRDEYNYLQTSNYNITIPERINDVKSMVVSSVEIPISFFNISLNLGNNCFKITDVTTGNNVIVTIPDGQYTSTTLQTTVTDQINSITTQYCNNLTYDLNGNFYNSIGYNSRFTASNSRTIKLDFAINPDGTSDKYNFKTKLGWILGFRIPSYTITTSIISEALIDLNGPRYLYLAVEEFNKGNQNSFVTPLYTSLLNKNILARISLNTGSTGFGSVLSANKYNGLLLSDERSYTGKIDILKLNVQLLDENGRNMVLNGLDFSFCLKVEHE
jgi:hypothetical protein